jgi:hypothetical protein
MRTQAIVIGGACFLVACLVFPAVAAPPDCGDCKYWDGDSCELVGDCTNSGECSGCQDCIDCFCTDADVICHWLHNLCHVCSNGTCVNTCDANQHCCYNECKECCGAAHCAPYECCIDGVCVSPKCDNCHAVSDTMFECGHYPDAPEGSACAPNWCIVNSLDSALCDYKGDDWPCPGLHCDTDAVFPPVPADVQLKVNGMCLRSPPGVVHRELWVPGYVGCEFCLRNNFGKACETWGCPGPVIETGGMGFKTECGCD